MNKLLTIIVPTYNMENYLRRCLDSLLIAEPYMQYFEAIVVNDGSTDSSLTIAQEYQVKHPSTFRIINKKNGNYGSCVNIGMVKAEGKYIRILDADDWFGDEFVDYIKNLRSLDVDMVVSDYQIFDQKKGNLHHVKFSLKPYTIIHFQELPSCDYFFAMHAITYRTELLRKMNYHQTEGISYTDTEWAFCPQIKVDTFVYLPYMVYHYLIGRSGQTMESRVIVKHVTDYYKLLCSMTLYTHTLSSKEQQNPSYKRMKNELSRICFSIYRICLVKQNDSEFSKSFFCDFDGYVKSEHPEAYMNSEKLIINKFFPIHYVRYWRICGKRFPVDKLRQLYRLIRYGRVN